MRICDWSNCSWSWMNELLTLWESGAPINKGRRSRTDNRHGRKQGLRSCAEDRKNAQEKRSIMLSIITKMLHVMKLRCRCKHGENSSMVPLCAEPKLLLTIENPLVWTSQKHVPALVSRTRCSLLSHCHRVIPVYYCDEIIWKKGVTQFGASLLYWWLWLFLTTWVVCAGQLLIKTFMDTHDHTHDKA